MCLLPHGYCGPFSSDVIISFFPLLLELLKNGHSVLLRISLSSFFSTSTQGTVGIGCLFSLQSKIPLGLEGLVNFQSGPSEKNFILELSRKTQVSIFKFFFLGNYNEIVIFY